MPRPKSRFVRLLRKLHWFLTVYMWPRHEASIQTLNGLLSFDSKDKILGRLLYLDREFEFGDMQELYEYLASKGYLHNPRDGTVLDVGGYIGMISTGFLLGGMFKNAVAVEPNPNNFNMILKNIEQNNLGGRISAYNLALSDCDGSLEMELSNKNYGDHRIRSNTDTSEGHFNESGRRLIKVGSQSLDDFLAAHKEVDADSIRLVWMDIQGHEGRFLAGAGGFFDRHKHVPVVMEFWPYAIKRSGIDKESFTGIVSKAFNSVILLDGHRKLMPISVIDEYFDRFDGPENGSHLILLNV